MKSVIRLKPGNETIKPLHGVNNCPVHFYNEKIPEFEDAGIPFVRTHDSGGPYGRGILIDIPNIFRDFDSDPEKAESYDFAFTDIYIRNLVTSGCGIFYRLGITIENFYRIKSYRTAPPGDFKKWARICKGVIRHYNEGWADGFHYGIKYWEIWNEPENPPMWSGTMEEYFRLYSTTAEYLKRKFPEIKVGGYASCGFYSVTRKNTSEFYKSFLHWFDEFLLYLRKNDIPLDFFSWHLYTSNPGELVAHAQYVEEKLKTAGFTQTENIFNEWNFINPSVKGNAVFDSMKEMPGALFVAEAFCRMQDSPIDKAMYYDAEPTRSYCGLFYFPSEKVTPTYYVFKMFNELYKLENRVLLSGLPSRNTFGLGAADSRKTAIMLVNRGNAAQKLKLDFDGDMKNAEVILLDKNHLFIPRRSLLRGKVLLLPGKSVLLLKTSSSETMQPAESQTPAHKKSTKTADRKNFAGLDE